MQDLLSKNEMTLLDYFLEALLIPLEHYMQMKLNTLGGPTSLKQEKRIQDGELITL